MLNGTLRILSKYKIINYLFLSVTMVPFLHISVCKSLIAILNKT
jgi:hypothetical protein